MLGDFASLDVQNTYRGSDAYGSIEEFHKSVKQNSSFEKSPTRIVTSQLNHIYYSILGFCRLERLKLKKSLNHFAIAASQGVQGTG
ncbi:hypothetical protein [Piscirickettsia salmonis]|uniref:hypothetical protein n=1 Tax=Piscirickettsia salmonis TaxID=1238 RepID=UPI0012B742D4|nr:hypothetical protein [Piscirickettsia salmonis]